MTVETYSPKRVELIFGGVPIRGFADGTFISASASAAATTARSACSANSDGALGLDLTGYA